MSAVRSKAFSSEPVAASEARHWVLEALDDIGWQGPRDEPELLVSELVTNSLRHAAKPLRVTLYQHDDGLWVSVSDSGPGTVEIRHPEPTDTSGRGLEIVEHVSGAWGVITEPASKSVWFELSSTR